MPVNYDRPLWPQPRTISPQQEEKIMYIFEQLKDPCSQFSRDFVALLARENLCADPYTDNARLQIRRSEVLTAEDYSIVINAR